MSDAELNPYRSPDSDDGNDAVVRLSLQQCCWKYAKLGAVTAGMLMAILTLAITGMVIYAGIFISPKAWHDGPPLVGASLGLAAMMTALCAGAGAIIGLLLYPLQRRTTRL